MKLSEVDAALDQYGWRASCRPTASGGWVWIGTSKAEPHATVSASSGEVLVAAVRYLVSESLPGERDDDNVRVIMEQQAADDRRQREYDRRHSERPPLF